MIFAEHASLEEKLRILSDAAKYDVACTSSGVSRKGKDGQIGNTSAAGICHSFSADGRCISLLKILFTNECIYNCKYCINRVTNDVPRATFTPEELTMEFYRRNYIEGLFLSSGIIHSADHTMELICQTLHDLRTIHRFHGYIHCKAIPGASPELVELAGWYADRMSVNMELPTAEGLRQLAPNKDRRQILTPMRQIQSGMEESRQALGMKGGNRSAYWHTSRRLGRSMPDGISRREGAPKLTGLQDISGGAGHGKDPSKPEGWGISGYSRTTSEEMGLTGTSDRTCQTRGTGKLGGLQKEPETRQGQNDSKDITKEATARQKVVTDDLYLPSSAKATGLTQWRHHDTNRGFVPAGQSTQMIIGAGGESDYEIMSVSEALYQRFDLKRVFYSAFINVNQDASLPALESGPPLRREHRLYQADFLLRYYGFEARELLSPSRPNFNVFLDPKCDWALGHMESFPIEINTADYNTLLRVPGIGVKSASRIVKARRTGSLDYSHLKKMGVVLKRAVYFITCNGRMMYDFLKVDEDFITRRLVGEEKELQRYYQQNQIHYQQLSLFDFAADGN